VATIRLGHNEENLRRQAQALFRLRAYDDDDESLGLLELAAAYEDTFAKSGLQPKSTARSKDGIELLLSEIGRYPLLTARQERAILEELETISTRQRVQQGNRIKEVRVPLEGYAARFKGLRELLVVHNLRLCFYLSKKYAINEDEIFDLFQESVIGLLRAIDLIEPGRNLRFATYAFHWVRQSITRWIVTKRLLIRLPVHRHDLPKEERPWVNTVSLDGQDSEGPYELIDDTIRTPSSDLEGAEKTEIIRASLKTLNERHAAIVGLRFGLNGSDARTLEEVAQSYGLTRERIRQIEEKALVKLRFRLQERLEDLR
jgi:RNA polymerase sigma factor (sigma-70 family)